MKILITGGSGLLGKYLLQTIPDDCEVTWTWHSNHPESSDGSVSLRMDLRDAWQVGDVVDRIKPDIIIHCAAMGSVDYAEENYQEVREINATGTEHLIKAATRYKSKFVYISSNAVYDGKSPPYDENSPLNPINAYGLIKQKAEQIVMQSELDYVIVRPFMLYGWPFSGGRTNWGKSIVESLMMRETVKLVNDIYWMPTYAGSCAKIVWDLTLTETNEIFNVASPQSMTLYEFGLKVAEVLGEGESLISPIKSDYFPDMVQRPVDTTYELRKLESKYGRLPSVENGLRRMKSEL